MYVDFLFSLKFSEIFFFTTLFIICLWDLGKKFREKNWINFFKPTTLFCLLIIFYCLIGPILSSAQEDGSIMYRAVNHRDFYEIGLIASLITYLSFKFGFNYKNYFKIKKFGINKLKEYRLKTKDYLFLHKWGERIILFTFSLQFLYYGASLIPRILNTSINSPLFYVGVASSYIGATVNFLIFGVLLLFIALLNGTKERTKFIFYLAITVGLFLNLGFRYRLLLLFLPLILIYFFYKKMKPSIVFLLSLFLSASLFFAFIQLARGYGTGLSIETYRKDIENIKDPESSELAYLLKSAFFDTNVFHTAAGMIYKTPEEYDYVGIKPIVNAISAPVPRILWKEKPSGKYINNIYRKIYEGAYWEVGAANLGFAEYYLSGGWIALIITNFFLGLLFKKIWFEFLLNFNDPLAQIRYGLYLSYMYIIFTRGYLLQLIYIYAFLFIPFYYFAHIWNKRYR